MIKNTTLKNAIRNALFLAGALTLSAQAQDFSPSKPECIAPAKPGGGFDITCRIAVTTFQELDLLDDPMRVTYMPGGIGAVAAASTPAPRSPTRPISSGPTPSPKPWKPTPSPRSAKTAACSP